MGQLKRKDPDHIFEDKICPWCEKLMKRTKQPMVNWLKIKHCSSRCATLYKNNGCSEREFKGYSVVKYCAAVSCGKLLFKKENETLSNWKRRRTCDKSCAAKGNTSKPKKPVISLEDRSHVKHYVPGTPEFNAIAALYL